MLLPHGEGRSQEGPDKGVLHGLAACTRFFRCSMATWCPCSTGWVRLHRCGAGTLLSAPDRTGCCLVCFGIPDYGAALLVATCARNFSSCQPRLLVACCGGLVGFLDGVFGCMWMVEPDIMQQVVSLETPTPSFVCARAATFLSVRARSSERLESHVVLGTRVFYLGVFLLWLCLDSVRRNWLCCEGLLQTTRQPATGIREYLCVLALGG